MNRGQYNFDVIRIEFFRERQAGFEAFKKGDITIREEFTSKTWAEEYDFPAMRDGRAIKMLFPAEARPKLQAWFINTIKAKEGQFMTRQMIIDKELETIKCHITQIYFVKFDFQFR